MKASLYHYKTLRDTPSDAELISHQLMIKSNMIKPIASGIYTWLPLGTLILKKVENIIRAELSNGGCLEIIMPLVQPKDLWDLSGRSSEYGPELLGFKDRNERDFYLGPTHEEIVTELAKKEVKKVSAYVFKQILVLLHPFIPFVTEEIWLKNKFDNMGNDFLMFKNWISAKSTKDSHTDQVENIINIISELRSFKNELNVSPGSFIDISINNINKDQKQFISSNEIILKKLGRINNILSDDLDKPAATMVVSGDLFKIYFDKDVDLKLIKENLTSKQERLEQEMHKISQRLENKSFVDRAPKEIVEQEKTNYNNLKNDVDKISITIKGI